MKVYVRVEDPPEFFPAETESLNAERLEDGNYRLKNSSIFAPGVAYGDVVTVVEDEKGLLWLGKVDVPSGYSAVRIACLSCDREAFIDALEDTAKLGAGYSFHDEFGVAIITIPPDVSYREVMHPLNSLPADEVQIAELAKRHLL